ncbi:MAG TPA: type VI secretion system baseplate subunit TssK [Longimicrobium sp.]|nr:type VI secretion system baseplate subunit TssK [Longimicrobium sp.]
MTTMRQMQKVLWTKGTLLTPQHLQAQDRFLEELMGFQLASLTFFPWGFSRLEVDAEALSGGTFALTAAAGLFPDRLPFDLPATGPLPPPKPLKEAWPADAEWLDVYLAIPEHRPGERNVSLSGADGGVRFSAQLALRRDENTGRAEKPIQLARQNLRLLTGGEALAGHAVLRAARVVRARTGTFGLDPHFAPPLLDLGASSYLLGIARRLVELMSARSAALAATRRQRNGSLADFGGSDAAHFWLLYSLNTHLPRLRHLLEVRRGHPGELWSAMLELAGTLTTFSPSVHPRDLPAYDHQEPSQCFGELDELLRRLLTAAVPEHAVTLPLRPAGQMIYATPVEDERCLAAPELYLGIRAEMKLDQLLRKVPQLLKVGSADQMDRLIRRALPGMSLRHAPTLPPVLPAKLGWTYFHLDCAGEDWEAVRRARNLAVYAPVDFPSPQIDLVALLPQER